MQNFSNYVATTDPKLAKNPNVMTANGDINASLARAQQAGTPGAAVQRPSSAPVTPKADPLRRVPPEARRDKGSDLLKNAPFMTVASQAAVYAAANASKGRAAAGAAKGSY